MAYELTKIAYAYNALEPHIDARTMESITPSITSYITKR